MGLERTTFCMGAAVRFCSHPFPQRRYLQWLRSKRANASEPERTPNLAILATEPGARNHRSRRTSAARLGGILRDSVNVVERRPGHARGRGFESRRSRLEKRLQIGTLCCLLGPWPIRDRAPAGRCLIGDQARSVDVLTQELLRPRLRRRYRAGRCERADLFNGQTQRESSTAASVLANSGG
jgi:hypothetical protein